MSRKKLFIVTGATLNDRKQPLSQYKGIIACDKKTTAREVLERVLTNPHFNPQGFIPGFKINELNPHRAVARHPLFDNYEYGVTEIDTITSAITKLEDV